ncbi:MAG: hypothetical protein JO314_10980 [Acidobacteria bacterium]|nr:hypothetical protein [Acidobacteriota bacterium]
MPSKYDTNPLDPDFPEKVRAEAEGQATQVLSETGAPETHRLGYSPATEEQTVRLPGGQQQYAPPPPPYQQPYAGQYVPAPYQYQSFATPQQPVRKVEPFGISENIVTALPYIPWYLGLIAGAVILALSPRSEAKARFHAAQGLAAHLGILIVSTALGIIGIASGAARAGSLAFTIATSVLLIVWAIKAWKGKPVHIQAIEGLTNWLEDKIRRKET